MQCDSYHLSPIFMKKLFRIFSALFEIHSTCPDKPLRKKQFADGLGSCRTGSAMHQASLCQDTCDLKFWTRW